LLGGEIMSHVKWHNPNWINIAKRFQYHSQ